MKKSPPATKTLSKVLLWTLIAVYTYNLPNARVVYDALVNIIGQETTGKVPLVMVAVTGMVYGIAVLITQKNLKNLLFLVPCGVIALMIITLEPNPNKHIHIPQYILMSWLFFAVLSMDYKSADIFILVFIYASILGVVDELEQGIHPARFYGWSDMLINSASALIGVFTIMGLKKMNPVDLGWTRLLKELKGILWLVFFGLLSSTIMCFYLFRVQNAGVFFGVYPDWLWASNLLIMLIIPPAIIFSQRRLTTNHIRFRDKQSSTLAADLKVAQLWTAPMLVILFYIQLLLIYISISGSGFA